MNLGYLGSAYKSRRKKSGFSMVLTVVIGLILTVIALGLMVASQNEVQVASNQSRSVSSLNAAEAGGTIALNEIVVDGNSVKTSDFAASDLLNYMCAGNSQFVSVKQVTGLSREVTYRLLKFGTGPLTTQFLNKDGTVASSPTGSDAYDPLLLSFSSEEILKSPNTAIINKSSFGSNLNIAGLPFTTTNCSAASSDVYPKQVGTGATASYTYFPSNEKPGAYGLVWSTANPRVQKVEYDSTKKSTDITLFPTRMTTLDGNDVCSAPRILNFKLSLVEVINNLANSPTGGFRLVYSFTIYSEGQLRVPSAAGACQGRILGRQIVQSPNILVLNVTPPGSFAQFATFVDYFDPNTPYYGGSTYDGKVHINTAPSFRIEGSDGAVVFKGEFTTAGCKTAGSAAATCQTANISAKKYGTISGKVNGTSSSTISDYVKFQQGAKYAEDGVGYIPAPSTGAFQTKAAIYDQKAPSATVAADLMKASEIQAAIGIKNTGTEPANGAVVPGVYWVNPTDTAVASTDASKPADYNAWLAKASAPSTSNPQNTTSNMLSGIYISGSVDYVNLYAAKSSGAVSSPDQQVVEIRQTTGSGPTASVKKFKFTITPGQNKTTVEVDPGTGTYGAAIPYGKALNGVVVIDGSIGDSTVGCTAQESCRGLISIPPDGSTTTPTIQKDSGVGIYANGNVAIQDNLTYEVDPRSTGGSAATNTLGVAAFPTRSYLDASGNVVSTTLWPNGSTTDPGNGTPPVNGSIYWGNGLKDNALNGTAPDGTTAAKVVNLQASFYSYTQGLNPADKGVNFADYINLLGGQITKVQGTNGYGDATTGAKVSGARMNLAGDSRFQNGTIFPPGYPKNGTTSYQVGPVGRQSIGSIRWQLLPDPKQ
jgi:hypothetical protein